MAEIDIIIDSMTDCLIHRETGEAYDTEYRLVRRAITAVAAKALKNAGWRFDWTRPQKRGYEVYELLVKGEDEAQGMIALKHLRDQRFSQIDIAESAPWNVGRRGRYAGVGAHLFAIACKLSMDAGNDGYVQFIAKTALVEHYRKTVHANVITGQNMFIDTAGALFLINKYFGEDEA